MQLAIDLPALAKVYFAGTIDPYPSTLTSRYMTGWGFPYEEWPQDLKDEYAYNPGGGEKAAGRRRISPRVLKTNICCRCGCRSGDDSDR